MLCAIINHLSGYLLSKHCNNSALIMGGLRSLGWYRTCQYLRTSTHRSTSSVLPFVLLLNSPRAKMSHHVPPCPTPPTAENAGKSARSGRPDVRIMSGRCPTVSRQIWESLGSRLGVAWESRGSSKQHTFGICNRGATCKHVVFMFIK